MDKKDVFQTNDLSEKKDISNVTNTLIFLGRTVRRLNDILYQSINFSAGPTLVGDNTSRKQSTTKDIALAGA